MVTLLGFSFVGISTAIAADCERSPCLWKNNTEAWQGQSIEVGGITYLPFEAIPIMQLPVKGDKSLTLFKATAAATLNIQVLNCPPPPPYLECPPLQECWPGEICAPLDQANAWLRTYGVKTNVRADTEMWQSSHGEDIYMCLDSYTNGAFSSPD